MKKIVLAGALASLFALPVAAQQSEPCMLTVDMYQIMIQQYGESRVSTGITPSGRMVEFWGNPESGSWTVVETAPNGISCARASGGGFERHAPEPNV